ncbi:MAG: hypothetical protein ACD_79C01255G0004 [uncultured bacterium]|nr:MAG: hypothetical protein ACD_79C01255G0004 [uncultured bacterium]
MNILNQMLKSCISFESYDKILNQTRIKSFLYFLSVMILFCILLYPKYFNRNTGLIFPFMDFLSQNFPPVEFKDNQISSPFDNYILINHPLMSIVIDPSNKFKEEHPLKSWIIFNKSTIVINYEEQQIQAIPYYHPLMMALLTQLADFKKGSGVLKGEAFLKLKELLKQDYFSSGVFFSLYCLVIGFVFSIIISGVGFLYSKMINTSLNWINIRNISYYAITPVLLFMLVCYYLNFDFSKLNTIFILMYSLFLCGAIYKHKLPPEEDIFDL